MTTINSISLAGGRMVERWGSTDRLAMLTQLGIAS